MNRKNLKLITILAFGLCTTPAYSKDLIILVDHSSGATTYSAPLSVAKGDNVFIKVTDTEKTCYTYNLDRVSTGIGAKNAAKNGTKAGHTDIVTFTDVHDGRTSAYEIDIKRRAGKTAAACPNHEIKKEFDVIVEGWNLAFSGTATWNKLVSSEYFLEPGSMANAMGQDAAGFFVRRNTAAENDSSTDFAVMAHLYHETKFNFSEGYQIQWAPLSFGFGTGEASNNQFYAGTSLKFGDRFFLTIGKVWGEIDRLPTNIELGGFTGDANAITTLGSRTSKATFVGLSYQFGGLDLTKLTSPFAPKKPKANSAQ